MGGEIKVSIEGKFSGCNCCSYHKYNGCSHSYHCMNKELPWYGWEKQDGCSHYEYAEKDPIIDEMTLCGVRV